MTEKSAECMMHTEYIKPDKYKDIIPRHTVGKLRNTKGKNPRAVPETTTDHSKKDIHLAVTLNSKNRERAKCKGMVETMPKG